jgi:signal transduction histidine kinase
VSGPANGASCEYQQQAYKLFTVERIGARFRSIDRRLPVLISGLLLVTVVAFSWTVYARVEGILLAAAGARLESASTVVSLMLRASQAEQRARFAAGAADPALAHYLATHDNAAAVRHVLAATYFLTPGGGAHAELRDASGAILLDTTRGVAPPASGWTMRAIRVGVLTGGTAVASPFFATHDSVYEESVIPITQGGRIIGYASAGAFTTAVNAQTVRDLVGTRARLLLGSPTEGVWTDFDRASPPPPSNMAAGRVTIFDDGIGAATAIPGTPFVLWVEQPRVVVLAPMRRLLVQIGILAVFFIAGGAAIGWVSSRRITRPLVSLTDAAEHIARTEGSGPAPAETEARDEVDRLTHAFSRMVARVDESRTELEQQVEEAQSLAEELEATNDELRGALTEADEAKTAAQNANRVKSDFLAVMSHELRTPLNAIIGYAELIRGELCGPVTSDQQEKLRRMRRSADELLRLINQVLDLERLGAGQEQVVLESAEVGDLMRAAAADVEPAAAERGLALSIIVPDPPLIVVTDVTKVQQILLNLMSNAIKYTEKGGVRVSVGQANGMLQFVVQDTGIGIQPEHRRHIFEPFWQADQRLTRRVGGTGLGLTIVSRLTQMLGGEITVESTPGQGSTFTVRLPMSPSRTAAA